MTISKIVIDRSMTILKGLETCPWVHLYRKCHWSMTVFKIVIDQWQFQKLSFINDTFLKHHVHVCTFTKIVIDRSMTILKGNETCPCMHLYRKCHWSMTVFKSVIDQWQFLKLSLIDQWQFSSCGFMAICLMDIVIDRTVNDNVHKLSWAKLSLTSINDKKNCHWVHLIYPCDVQFYIFWSKIVKSKSWGKVAWNNLLPIKSILERLGNSCHLRISHFKLKLFSFNMFGIKPSWEICSNTILASLCILSRGEWFKLPPTIFQSWI